MLVIALVISGVVAAVRCESKYRALYGIFPPLPPLYICEPSGTDTGNSFRTYPIQWLDHCRTGDRQRTDLILLRDWFLNATVENDCSGVLWRSGAITVDVWNYYRLVGVESVDPEDIVISQRSLGWQREVETSRWIMQ
jgi:hypothetical protein